jgi:hypothetical protein
MNEIEFRDTLVPASYPELVDEQWVSLCGEEARQTLLPPSSRQMSLELECAGLDVEDAQWEPLRARFGHE